MFQDVEKPPIVCWFQEDSHDLPNPTEMIQKENHCNKVKSTHVTLCFGMRVQISTIADVFFFRKKKTSMLILIHRKNTGTPTILLVPFLFWDGYISDPFFLKGFFRDDRVPTIVRDPVRHPVTLDSPRWFPQNPPRARCPSGRSDSGLHSNKRWHGFVFFWKKGRKEGSRSFSLSQWWLETPAVKIYLEDGPPVRK